MMAKKKALTKKTVVFNHALLLKSLKYGALEEAELKPVLILDEAHTLEDVICDVWADRITRRYAEDNLKMDRWLPSKIIVTKTQAVIINYLNHWLRTDYANALARKERYCLQEAAIAPTEEKQAARALQPGGFNRLQHAPYQ